MFPGGQPDLQEMLAQAQKLQEQLVAAQEELARTHVEGSAGGGLVNATVNGAGELVALRIAPEAVGGDDPADTAETVADLVLAAVRDATTSAAALQQQTMGPLTDALGGGGPGGPPGLPGM